MHTKCSVVNNRQGVRRKKNTTLWEIIPFFVVLPSHLFYSVFSVSFYDDVLCVCVSVASFRVNIVHVVDRVSVVSVVFFILSFQRKIQVWYHQCNSQYFVDAHCCWFVVSVCFVRCSSTCFIFHVLHLFLCVSELFLSFICRQVARLPNWFPFGFLFSLFNYFNEFLHDFSIDCDLSVSV